MKLWKIVMLVGLMSLAAGAGRATDERISALLRSMLSGGPLPTEAVFNDIVDDDYVRRLPPDSVKEFLPLARTLLHDSRPSARQYGMACFLTVMSRFADSQVLIEPYLPDLTQVMDDHANPLRRAALFALGNTEPRVSPKTLEYMAAHLTDKENPANEAGAMAWILLKERSDELTHVVIAFARKQNRDDVSEPILSGIHKYHNKNAEVLGFVDESLDSEGEWVRLRAVEIIADLPLSESERAPLLARLRRLSADPNQMSSIRSEAARALKKKE